MRDGEGRSRGKSAGRRLRGKGVTERCFMRNKRIGMRDEYMSEGK